MINRLLLFLIAIICSCCSYQPKNIHIFSLPEKLKNEPQEPITRLTFALTGSFQGRLKSQKEFYENNQGIFLNVGGCELLSKYVNVLKKYHQQNLTLVHIGSLIDKKKINFDQAINCLEKINYDLVAPSALEVTNRSLLKDKNLKNNFLVNNFINLKTGKPLSENPFISSKLLDKSGVKIGFISIFEPEITREQIGESFINGIFIEDGVTTILKEKNSLKKQGANIIVLAIQGQSQCQGNVLTLKNLTYSQLDCRFSDPLKNIIKKLPSGTIDLILSSSRSNMANGYLAEIPVLQLPGGTNYLGLAELYFNTTTKELVKTKTRVLPPLKICEKYFAKTQDCYMKSSKEFKLNTSRKDLIGINPELVTPKVLGVELEAN